MLKGIPPVLSPELLKVLAEMGHGDTLVIGDANFAAASMAKDSILVRCDGVKATGPDGCHPDPDAAGRVCGRSGAHHGQGRPPRRSGVPVWDEFKAIVAKHDERGADACAMIPRGKFYTMAKNAYAVVATTETAFYACTILQKGCL